MTEEYLTFGHRLEQHIADTSKLMWELLDDEQDGDPRGRPGRDARHRPRHLSVRHLVEPARGRGLRRHRRRPARRSTRSGASPRPTRRASARGRSRASCDDEMGEHDPRARRRVRHDHRAPAPHRLARPRRAALRRAPEHADRARRSPSSTCSRASTASRSARSYRGADGAEFDDFPYHQTVLHHTRAELHRAGRLEGGPRRVPHDVRPARTARASTSTSSPSRPACRSR